MTAVGQGRSTVANLESKIKHWAKRHDERQMKLGNAGLTKEQIEDILGRDADLADLKRDLESTRLKLAKDEAEISALQQALRCGQDHTPAVAA